LCFGVLFFFFFFFLSFGVRCEGKAAFFFSLFPSSSFLAHRGHGRQISFFLPVSSFGSRRPCLLFPFFVHRRGQGKCSANIFFLFFLFPHSRAGKEDRYSPPSLRPQRPSPFLSPSTSASDDSESYPFFLFPSHHR